MFGIGAGELAVIVLIIVVFVRPSDLPAFMRGLGKLYSEAKKAYRDVVEAKDDFIRELDIAAAADAAGMTTSNSKDSKTESGAAVRDGVDQAGSEPLEAEPREAGGAAAGEGEATE